MYFCHFDSLFIVKRVLLEVFLLLGQPFYSQNWLCEVNLLDEMPSFVSREVNLLDEMPSLVSREVNSRMSP